jgi:hypothetical protein
MCALTPYRRQLMSTDSNTGRHSTRTAAIVLLRLFLVLAFCVPVLAQQTPSPGPEHRKLQIWIGEWTYSGVAHETPLGPRTEFSGGFRDQLALNGFYVQGRWKDTFGEGIELHGYDAAAKAHKAFWFGDDGSRYDLTETYSKDTVSAPFTMIDAKGKQVRGKAVWKFSSDHSSFSATWELSTDNGKTWIPWMEYAGKKVKK